MSNPARTEVEGHRFVWHPGGNTGFVSHIIVAPDDDVAVVTMVNSNRDMNDGELNYAIEMGTQAMFKILGLN